MKIILMVDPNQNILVCNPEVHVNHNNHLTLRNKNYYLNTINEFQYIESIMLKMKHNYILFESKTT